MNVNRMSITYENEGEPRENAEGPDVGANQSVRNESYTSGAQLPRARECLELGEQQLVLRVLNTFCALRTFHVGFQAFRAAH